MGDATLTANVTAVLEDESFQAEVDADRATLRAAADAPTDLPAHEPSDSPAPATPQSSPAAVGTSSNLATAALAATLAAASGATPSATAAASGVAADTADTAGRAIAAADAPTDVQAHEPSDSPAPATPRSSPAAAVHMPSSAASDDKVASALDECVEELVAACDNLALAPTANHAGATATCNSVRAALAGVVGSARAESPPTQASHPTHAVYVDAYPMCKQGGDTQRKGLPVLGSFWASLLSFTSLASASLRSFCSRHFGSLRSPARSLRSRGVTSMEAFVDWQNGEAGIVPKVQHSQAACWELPDWAEEWQRRVYHRMCRVWGPRPKSGPNPFANALF
jgi:hypothetical protein